MKGLKSTPASGLAYDGSMPDDLPLFAPPPSADDPFALLKACHRKLEGRLDALAAVAARLAAGAPAEPAAVADALGAAIAHFDGPGRWHLEDEEASVLPRLLARDPAAAALIAALEPDHVAIEAGWAELRAVLAGLRDGLAQGPSADPALVARLQALLPPFTALHHRHHEVEETRVMPRARAALDAAEVAAIAAEMRARRSS